MIHAQNTVSQVKQYAMEEAPRQPCRVTAEKADGKAVKTINEQ
jgi:hypothetical protein